MSELKIVAVVTAKKEYQKDIEKALHNVVDGTRTEEGNVSYDLHVDIKNPLKYIIIEVWKSQEALNIHNATVHFNEFKKAIEGKIEGLDIDVVKKIY